MKVKQRECKHAALREDQHEISTAVIVWNNDDRVAQVDEVANKEVDTLERA